MKCRKKKHTRGTRFARNSEGSVLTSSKLPIANDCNHVVVSPCIACREGIKKWCVNEPWSEAVDPIVFSKDEVVEDIIYNQIRSSDIIQGQYAHNNSYQVIGALGRSYVEEGQNLP